MEKKTSRRESSERKPVEQEDNKDDKYDSKPSDAGPAEGNAQPAKNRRKRAGDEGGWMTSGGGGGTGGRHATLALPIEEDEPKESQAARLSSNL